jgi:fructose-1,6-bisphosphatase/inositol monophosphatase family enzyme
LIGTYLDGECEAVVLYDPLAGDMYSASAQHGCFLNQYRMRVSHPITPSDGYSLNCRALSIAYVAAGKLSHAHISTDAPASWHPALLLVSEARGSCTESDGRMLVEGAKMPTNLDKMVAQDE